MREEQDGGENRLKSEVDGKDFLLELGKLRASKGPISYGAGNKTLVELGAEKSPEGKYMPWARGCES